MRLLIPLTCASIAISAVLFGIFYHVPEFEDFRTHKVYFGVPESRDFEPVAAGLYKINLPWHLTPFHDETLDLYLVRSKGGWCLSDAGGYDTWLHRHASALLAAVKNVIGDDKLRYVLLTHGHIDHVGALPLLMEEYPELKVVIHEAEEEYIAGPKEYFPSANLSFQIHALQFLRVLPSSEFTMTTERLITLKGKKGDLSSLGIPELSWVHTPGHCPGHVVFLHTSGNMLAGDFADVLNDNGAPVLKVMGGDIALAKKSICHIVRDLKYSRILPYHDAFKVGYTKAEMLPLAEAYAKCSASK